MAAGGTEAGTRVCWPEQGRAELEPFSVRGPKAGEVLIRTEVTLISPGTERAFFLGLPNAEAGFPGYPRYSSIGRGTAVGEAVGGGARGPPLGVGGPRCPAPHPPTHP